MAAGRGAGAVRPQRGFGLHPELVPSSHVGADTETRGFAALTDRRLGLVAVVNRADWVERVLAGCVCTGQLRIKEGAREHLSREVLRSAGLRVGLSTHSYWEECRAHAWAPSCIACGPIHATTTKDMPWRPQGPDNLAYGCRVLREPVIAITGTDAPRSHEAVRCGAAGVAVLRGIVQASHPEGAIQGLRTAIVAGSLAAPLPAPELPRSTFSGLVKSRSQDR